MSRTVTVAEGDTAKAIVATLSNADGAQNLTGATVTLYLKDRETFRELSAACTLVTPASGIVSIPGALRSAWLSGRYVPEFVVTYNDASVDIFPCEDDDDLQDEYRVIVRGRRT